jgi:tetratricopeptide (TPR) repeat protein
MKRLFPVILLMWMLIVQAHAQYLTSAKLSFSQYRSGVAKRIDPAELQNLLVQAEASALKAVAKDDKDEEAWFLLGQIRYEMRKYPEMIEAFNKSLAVKPAYAEEIGRYRLKLWIDGYNAGVKYYNKGRDTASYWDTALDSLKVAILAEPDSSATYYVSALAYYGKKDYANAIAMLNTCLEKNPPKKTDILKMLGQFHIQVAQDKKDAKDEAGAVQEYKEAAATYEKLYQAEPKNLENLVTLLDLYERAGMGEKSLALTSECVKNDPSNRVCRFAYGAYLLKRDKFAESIEQLKAVIDLDPQSRDDLYKDATYNLGVAHLNWGVAMKEAADKKAEELKKAQKDKKGKKPQEEPADLSYKEKFKEALPYLEKTAELRKDDASIYQQLGRLYANLNMTKEAKTAFETADKIMKGN